MNKKGQLTIFIILGIVLVLAVILLFLASRSLNETSIDVEVHVDKTLVRTCLARSVEESLDALSNDGVIAGGLPSDGGEHGHEDVLPYTDAGTPRKSHMYIIYDIDAQEFTFGKNRVKGLCDPQGPNGRNEELSPQFGCAHGAYHTGNGAVNGISIQEMLDQAITNRMGFCVPESSGQAETILQDDGFVVRWTNPDVQHTERVSLQPIWKAIKYVVNNDVRDPAYNPELDDFAACFGCESVTAERLEGKGIQQPYERWRFTSGTYGVTIFFDNRPVSIVPPDGLTCADPDALCVLAGGAVQAHSADEDFVEADITGSVTINSIQETDGIWWITFNGNPGDTGQLILRDVIPGTGETIYQSNPITVQISGGPTP